MNRILTAAAALVASSAGVAGLAGTATADPAPGLLAAPTVSNGVDDMLGTLHPVTQSVGSVVPASERAAGEFAAGSMARTELPLLSNSRTPLDTVSNAVGNLVGKPAPADETGAAAPMQSRNGSSTEASPSSETRALPDTDVLRSVGALAGLPASDRGPTVDAVTSVGKLLGTSR